MGWRWLLVLLGFTSGCSHLALAEEGCRFGSARRCLDLAELSRRAGDPVSEVRALERACDGGVEEGCFFRALASWWGLGVPADQQRARNLLTAGCARGVRPACEWPQVGVADAPHTCVEGPGNGLEKEELRQVIELHSPQIRCCYEATLQDGDSSEGDVSVSWAVSARGEVVSAQITRNSFASDRIAECLRQSVLRWRFPCPRGGGIVSVTFPYMFRVKK